MIARSAIQDMFERARGYKWDINDVCRWSYFFAGRDREALASLDRSLSQAGYEFVGLLEPTPQDDDQELLFARFDRVERHTVSSLDDRNRELERVALSYAGMVYDGMDVGPAVVA